VHHSALSGRTERQSGPKPLRKWIDGRDYPDGTGCTLYLSGEADDIVRAAAEHAASVHGSTHGKDTPKLREQLRSMLNDETEVARV
jgi:hypothetical protein